MARQTKKDLQQAFRLIAKKAAVDKKFEKLALTNPAQALRQVTGQDVPQGVRIVAIEAGSSAIVVAGRVGGKIGHRRCDWFCCAIRGRCPCGSGRVYDV